MNARQRKLANTNRFQWNQEYGRITAPMSLVCPEPTIIPVCVHVIHAGHEVEFVKDGTMSMDGKLVWVEYCSYELGWTMRLIPANAPHVYDLEDMTLKEGTSGTYLTEASDLRFEPGRWPLSILVEVSYDRVETFCLSPGPVTASGEVALMEYVGPDGLRIVCFND